jgi:hypothetical protein
MKLLLKFPTRARPEKFKQTFDKYRSLLSGKHEIEWCISCDADDRTMNNARIIQHLRGVPNLFIYFGNSKTKIQAINADMSLTSQDWQTILLISDDMIPQAQDFDDIIARHMTAAFPDFDGALHFNDGRAGEKLNTLVCMGRKLYEQFGYIYHPQYKSLWCDNEFTDVTRRDGKSHYVDDTIIKHQWVDYTGKDLLHKRNEGFYGTDKATYEKRKAAGFPKHNV